MMDERITGGVAIKVIIPCREPPLPVLSEEQDKQKKAPKGLVLLNVTLASVTK